MDSAVNADGGQQRLLITLERLLTIQALAIKTALDQASQWVAEALHAEKVDAFLYDPAIDSLVAVGSSDTPMARLQHRLGLATVALANGGYAAEVYESGESFHTGRADEDALVPTGVWQRLGARSILAVPLPVGADRRGTLEVVSDRPNAFSLADLRFAEAVARWVGMVAQRAELAEVVARESAAQARRLAAEELITVLAHDLRQPLTVSQGACDLLHQRTVREGRTQDLRLIEHLRQALQRLGGMITALLDASHLEQGLFTLNLQPVDLVRLVRETTDLLATPQTPIHTRVPDELVIDQADAERLRQVLENLIGNALRHTPAGVPVVVQIDQEVRMARPWTVLTVRDEGPGIAPTLLPTLFERFARGEHSTGLGLGLYLARGIALAHGGTLEADSVPGSGTAFHLALPLRAADDAS